MAGLSVSDVVKVDVNMSPRAVPLRNFGALCIAGPSDVVDVKERLREYVSLTGVAEDFGMDAPEYHAAAAFFDQAPQPSLLYVGRFAQTATSGVLHGMRYNVAQQQVVLAQLKSITNGAMVIPIDGADATIASSAAYLRGGVTVTAEQDALLTTLQAITAGGFSITVNGTVHAVTAVDLSSADDLTEVASVIEAKTTAYASVEWVATDGTFKITSNVIGSTSAISYATAPGSGTDLSAPLKLTAATGATPPVAGDDGIDFTAITNLNGAATLVSNAMAGARCWFDGFRFNVQSLSTGTASSVGYAHAAGLSQDISGILGLRSGQATPPVNGIAAETPAEAAVQLRAHPEWYGLTFAVADTATITDDDYVEVATFIEGCSPISIFGLTTQDPDVLDLTIDQDICARLKAMTLMRTFSQYSSYNAYACCSIYGREFTIDFEGSNTTNTVKFKQQPGITGEILTENEARAIDLKNCNVYVFYSNGASIIQQGVMANGFFFDEVQGTDWQANRVQTDLFNVLYQANTKIPQTNAGVHILVTTVEASLNQGVVNGLIAPGQWNAPGFGQITFGQMLPKGYYVWAPLLESQPQAIREKRVAPTIQCAIKLAGAVHFANVVINVNR